MPDAAAGDLRAAGQRLRVATINIRGWNNYTSTRDVQDLIDAGGMPECAKHFAGPRNSGPV
jgi:hypothetical protein